MDITKINAWAQAVILLVGQGKALWSAIEGLFHSAGLTTEERAAIIDAVMQSASFEAVLTRMASGRDNA